MKRHILCLAAGLAALAVMNLGAAEKQAEHPIEGKWRWTFERPDGERMERLLTLKKEGDQLKGTISGRAGAPAEIKEGSVEANKFKFKVERERDGRKFTMWHSGEVKDEELVGKVEVDFGGEKREFDFRAKRVQPAAVSGLWEYTFTTQGGRSFDPKIRLDQKGQTLTGYVQFGERQIPIEEGRIEGDVIRFVIRPERNGEKWESVYEGKVEKDVIEGKVKSNWGGEERSYDLFATRLE